MAVSPKLQGAFIGLIVVGAFALGRGTATMPAKPPPPAVQHDQAALDRMLAGSHATHGGSEESVGLRAIAEEARRQEASEAATQEIVYLSATGKRYHREGCRTLKREPTAATRSDAEAEGRTPCRVCEP